ncbi:unnamed protein product [Adineta ricciae]|uniref:G-protein coupled receptors family 1 profile domain-containing protein n=1 Tax=Adineta ricciae TaxID=249248 RepID=A0A815PAY1_ADIRI|nr:unnamed protein product [Adineta ricciae]CAF1483941.1 unnamed protein product [Adineta ricciae]
MLGVIIPIVLLIVFDILTLHNAYKIRRRVGPLNNNLRIERLRSNDRQMLVMLLFQLAICLLLSIPSAALDLYDVFLALVLNNALQPYGQAIFIFSLNFFRILYCCNSVIGFYTYTLMGPNFRKEFKRCTRHGLRIILTTTKLMECLPLSIQ